MSKIASSIHFKDGRNRVYTVDLAKDCPTEPVEQLTNSDNEVVDAELDGQLANSDNMAPDVEDTNVREEMKVTITKTKSHRKRKEKKERGFSSIKRNWLSLKAFHQAI